MFFKLWNSLHSIRCCSFFFPCFVASSILKSNIRPGTPLFWFDFCFSLFSFSLSPSGTEYFPCSCQCLGRGGDGVCVCVGGGGGGWMVRIIVRTSFSVHRCSKSSSNPQSPCLCKCIINRNGGCARYIMVSKTRGCCVLPKTQHPFQNSMEAILTCHPALSPQNDWTGWQFRVNDDICPQTPLKVTKPRACACTHTQHQQPSHNLHVLSSDFSTVTAVLILIALVFMLKEFYVHLIWCE